jgi:hypothetical protein
MRDNTKKLLTPLEAKKLRIKLLEEALEQLVMEWEYDEREYITQASINKAKRLLSRPPFDKDDTK